MLRRRSPSSRRTTKTGSPVQERQKYLHDKIRDFVHTVVILVRVHSDITSLCCVHSGNTSACTQITSMFVHTMVILVRVHSGITSACAHSGNTSACTQ